MKIGRLTIKEVASAAGVSTQTVSRVINERPDVSPETRKRVQKLIEQMGYQPSALARSLIRQRSHTLGVVTAGLKYIGPSQRLSGIASEAEKAGYSLLLKELSHFDEQNITPILQALVSRQVDGIIWAVPEIGNNRDWIGELTSYSGVPIVYLTMEARKNISIVSIDNYQGGRLAMAHLLEQGYEHIGHISGPMDWWESRQRIKAWRDALTDTGLETRDDYWVEGNWSSASGAQAAEELFKRYPRMDAVFVANDQMALSVLQAASQRGIRVPEDLGVVGFDNIAESAFFWPALTTVQQDQYELAKVAFEEIIKIIESNWQGEESVNPKSIVIPPTLVVRQSSVRLAGNKGGETEEISKRTKQK